MAVPFTVNFHCKWATSLSNLRPFANSALRKGIEWIEKSTKRSLPNSMREPGVIAGFTPLRIRIAGIR